MDEKEAEKRVIYNFINKHKYSDYQDDLDCLKRKENSEI
jgi:hypothetical protein